MSNIYTHHPPGSNPNVRGQARIVPTLLSLSDGTLVRASSAWWASDNDRQVRASGNNELRSGAIGFHVLEGSATNEMTDDPVDLSTVGGWAVVDSSGSATVTANAGLAPDGTMTAALLTFGADSLDRLQGQAATPAAATLYRAAFWARTVTGTKQFVLQFNDGVTVHAGGTETATTEWQRFTITYTTDAAPINGLFRIKNTSAEAGSMLVWGADVQDDAPNLHPSPVLQASALKALDDLSFTGLSGDLFDVGFWVRMRPYFSDTEHIAHNRNQWVIAPTSARYLRWQIGTARFRLSGDVGAFNAPAFTWAARDIVDVKVDWTGNIEARVNGGAAEFTTATSTSGDWSAETTLQVGASPTTTQNYFGEMSDIFPLSTWPY